MGKRRFLGNRAAKERHIIEDFRATMMDEESFRESEGVVVGKRT